MFKATCNDMTPSECNKLCQGYAFYGIQWFDQCFCAPKAWHPRYGKTSESECRTPCKGDLAVMCGGGWHNSIHQVSKVEYKGVLSKKCKKAVKWKAISEASKKHVPTTHPGPGVYLGCFQDHPKRDMPVERLHSKGIMSATVCSKLCQGYKYYGLQNHRECRCAGMDWLPSYGKRNNTDCNAVCTGDTKTMCGGPWRNSIFRLT